MFATPFGAFLAITDKGAPTFASVVISHSCTHPKQGYSYMFSFLFLDLRISKAITFILSIHDKIINYN